MVNHGVWLSFVIVPGGSVWTLANGHKTYGILAYISYSVSFAPFPLFASKFGWPVNLPLIEDNQAISGISFLAATEASADRGQMWTPVCSVEVSRAGSDGFACRVANSSFTHQWKAVFLGHVHIRMYRSKRGSTGWARREGGLLGMVEELVSSCWECYELHYHYRIVIQ